MNSERQPWWGWLLVVLVPLVILLAGPAVGWRDAYLGAWYEAGYAAGVAAGRSQSMSSWEVSGAGDATCNGTYVETAYTWQGQPVYQLDATHWLCLNVSGTFWVITPGFDPVYGPPPSFGAYASTGTTLPGNPWSVLPGGTAPAPTVAEVAAGLHTIEGTVLESDDTPVEGVDVLATLGSTFGDTTDAYGEYEITGLGDGTWVVTTQSLALADPHRIWLTGSPLKSASASVTFGSPTPIIATVNWTLYWGAAGQVTLGASGLAGVTVDIYTAAGVLEGSVLTDNNGDWSWPGGPKGTYVARFTKAGYTFTPAQVTIDLTGSAPVTGADAVASRGDVLFQGTGAGQGTAACLLTLVRALKGTAAGAATGTCVLTVASPADKRKGAYYRYLTRMWSE